MVIFITLNATRYIEERRIITELLDFFIFFKNLLCENSVFEINKLVIWEKGPNIVFGNRLETIEKSEEIQKHLINVDSLIKILEKHQIVIKSNTLKVPSQKSLIDFISSYQKYKGFEILSKKSFALEVQGIFHLDEYKIPSYIKFLNETGFEQEYGDVYFDMFKYKDKGFIELLEESKNLFSFFKNLAQKMYKDRLFNLKKIIIGEDQVSNLYCLGSILFWYQKIEDFFDDLDSLMIALSQTGTSETTLFLNNLGIIGLWDDLIIEDMKNYRRVYKLENMRKSYSNAKEMTKFIQRNALDLNLPISMTYSYALYDPKCKPNNIAGFLNKIIRAVHKIFENSLKKEEEINQILREETNRVLKKY